MPPTFDAGLRRPNSLIRARVCAFFTCLASLPLVAVDLDFSYELSWWTVKRAIDLALGEIEDKNRVTDLCVSGAMTQKRAEPFEPKPLQRSGRFCQRNGFVGDQSHTSGET